MSDFLCLKMTFVTREFMIEGFNLFIKHMEKLRLFIEVENILEFKDGLKRNP